MIVVSAVACKHAVPSSICFYAVLCIILVAFDKALSAVLLAHQVIDSKCTTEGGPSVPIVMDCLRRVLRSEDSHLVRQREHECLLVLLV